MSTSLRSQNLLLLFLLFCLKKLLIAEQTTFYDKENSSCHRGQLEPNHIQRMLLVQGEVMGGWRLAPLWRMTNSNQKTAQSRDFIG